MIKKIIKKTLNLIVFYYYKNFFLKNIIKLNQFCDLRNIKDIYILYEGGFGHTISEISIIENYEKNKSCFVFFFQKRRYHNKYLKILKLNKVKIFTFEIPILFYNYWDIEISKKVFILIQKSIKDKNVKNFDLIEKNIKVKFSRSCENGCADIHWFNKEFVFSLKKNFNKKIEKIIYQKVNNAYYQKILILLRYKKDRNDFTNYDRNGYNTLETYKNLIKYIAEKKYLLFLHTDFIFSKNEKRFLKQYPNVIFSNKYVNLNKEILYLYFATNSKYVITESGGGLVLPALSERKILHINCWPLKHITPNSLILFKHIYDNDNKKNLTLNEMIANKLFYDGEYDLKKNYYTLVNNSSSEILNAFIELEQTREISDNKNFDKFHDFCWSYANKNFLLSKSRDIKND